MKIGVLTYHRSHNYGALLQAIALRKTLENLGHEVYFVDYWPEYHRKMYAMFDKEQIKWESPIRTLYYVMRCLIFFPFKFKRANKFSKFICSFISPYCKDVSDCFDLIVCGSDQIWRKQPGLHNKFNSIYFAQGETNADVYISYAASMGNINITKDEEYILANWFKRFRHISVREESLKKVLVNMQIQDVNVVADPTLLFFKDQWQSLIGMHIFKRRKKYVLYYNLQLNSFDVSSIKKYAHDHNFELVKLRAFAGLDSYKNNTITCADPYDMIRLIANAEMVFTSSYHGLVFSIIFERQFFASFSTNSGRAESLLEYLNLKNRLISKQAKEFPNFEINYLTVAPLLDNFRKESLCWLLKSLNNIS